MSCDLTVVLPSYLEEENLRLLLPRIKEHCQHLTSNFEILIIDTMTPMDGTAEVCKEVGVTYLNRRGGNTYGDAVRTGISNSKGSKVIFMDADGSHPPSVLDELYQHKDQAQIVIASRYVKGGYTENTRVLVLMSLIVNMGYRIRSFFHSIPKIINYPRELRLILMMGKNKRNRQIQKIKRAGRKLILRIIL